MKTNNTVHALVSSKRGQSIARFSVLSLSMLCLSLAHAAEDPKETPASSTEKKVIKVKVTGSSIKGVAAQSASPITIIKGEDLAKQGVTTVEEAVSKVSANQPGFSTSQNVGRSGTSGSTANLRGLGSNKTLILLNGRRLANSPFLTASTNLNIIPFAMIERIEVLRDGASAVYGTDAIGGVINFITKSSFQGLSVSGGLIQPEESGGDKQDISIFGGYGDLNDQGFNIYGVVDYRRTNNIMAKDRSVSRRGGVLPELGINGVSFNGFPANFYDPGSDVLGNPYGNSNCNNAPNTSAKNGYCYLNTQALIGITPKTETISALGRGTFKITDSLNAVAEYIYTRDVVETSIAPDVYSSTVTLPSSSPYYPGNGTTPAVDGLSGQPLNLYLRSQSGNRMSETTTDSHRAFAGIEGEAYGWDINAGVTYATSEATDSFIGGYLNQSKLQSALNAGTINPFGASSDMSLWDSFVANGDSQTATLDSTTVDFTLSRPIFKLPAGDVGFAIGASFNTQEWENEVNSELVAEVPGSGVDPNTPKSTGERDISAVFSELHIPITEKLEAQLAARYDDYSDFGDTFNPKVALRWEPSKKLMFRTSYSTGFRAPSLYDMNSPQTETYTGSRYNDPVLCPGGGNEASDVKTECDTQFKRLQGGNDSLEPEESTSYTLGMVFEPLKNLVLTVDYYNVEVENLIDTLSESMIFGNTEKYAEYFVRSADGKIDYIASTLVNMGGVKTEGIDISLNYLSPMTSTGRFGFGFDGTYVLKYEKQDEKGGAWVDRVGSYYNQTVYQRWKHVANVNWSFENWKMVFEQEYSRGYDDHNATGEAGYDDHRVGDYIVYNIAGTYSGFKNLELTAGIKNMFDKEPPASNVTENFQYGYDASYADPTGRAYYLRATYKF